MVKQREGRPHPCGRNACRWTAGVGLDEPDLAKRAKSSCTLPRPRACRPCSPTEDRGLIGASGGGTHDLRGGRESSLVYDSQRREDPRSRPPRVDDFGDVRSPAAHWEDLAALGVFVFQLDAGVLLCCRRSKSCVGQPLELPTQREVKGAVLDIARSGAILASAPTRRGLLGS